MVKLSSHSCILIKLMHRKLYGDEMQPFRKYDLTQSLYAIPEKVRARVDEFTDAELMANDVDILCRNLYAEFRIEPVVIDDATMPKPVVLRGKIEKYLDHIHYFEGGRTIIVDGITLSFAFPFSGEKQLFECRGSTFTFSPYPAISIQNGCVIFKYSYDEDAIKRAGWHDSVISRVKGDLSEIKQGLSYVNSDAEKLNQQLPGQIRSAILAKKSRIEALYKAAESFDVSVGANEVAQRIISVPKRKIYPIAHTYNSATPEYSISAENYAEILKVIKHTAMTWERTPNSYRHMGEEDLRNVLLASLNGLFLGKANGEAFRKDGKTDICIEAEDRTAFIAECKMWTGEGEVHKAFDQLDSYSTWRDCKAALIYFVDRKDFLAIAGKMLTVLQEQKDLQGVRELNRNEFVCRMLSTRTPGHVINVRVLLFNLHSDEDKKGASK